MIYFYTVTISLLILFFPIDIGIAVWYISIYTSIYISDVHNSYYIIRIYISLLDILVLLFQVF